MNRRADSFGLCVMLAVSITAIASTASADSLPFQQRLNALIFGEIDYRERESQGDDGFVIGQTAVQLNLRLAERLSAFTELTATAREGEGFEFEIERLFVRYDFSDAFKLSGGRYHTPLGYWNSAFHHGAWLQTTASRPEIVRFGSQIVPIHFVGILLEGNLGQSDFGYRIGFGNGRSDSISDPGDLGDANKNPAGLVAIDYRPPGRHQLNAGLSAYFDRVRIDDAPDVDEQIVSAHLAIEGETPEVLVEYFYSRHESSVSKANAHGAYAQFAYRLPGAAHSFKPYVRVEWQDVDNRDPLLGGRGLDHKGVLAGTRWDFSSFAVLKVEGRREEFDDRKGRWGFWVQLAFVFDATADRSTQLAQASPLRGAP